MRRFPCMLIVFLEGFSRFFVEVILGGTAGCKGVWLLLGERGGMVVNGAVGDVGWIRQRKFYVAGQKFCAKA